MNHLIAHLELDIVFSNPLHIAKQGNRRIERTSKRSFCGKMMSMRRSSEYLMSVLAMHLLAALFQGTFCAVDLQDIPIHLDIWMQQ